MNLFWRFTLLSIVAAAGAGMAVGVAHSSKPADAAPYETLAVAVDDRPPVESDAPDAAEDDLPLADDPADLPPGSGDSEPAEAAASEPSAETRLLAAPLVAEPSPRIEAPHAGAPNEAQESAVQVAQLPALDQLLQSAGGGQSADDKRPASPPSEADLMEQLRRHLQRSAQPGASAPPAPAAAQQAASAQPAPAASPTTAAQALPAPNASRPRIKKIPGEGDDQLSIHIQDSDLRDVLELLGEQGGINILPSQSVQGKVSATLTGVNVDDALAAILRSTGFVAQRDGQFVYVGTPQDFKAMEQALDQIGTRIYRLNYVRASDIQALIQPVLTPGIGVSTVTAPAETGIAPDDTKAGGDQFAGGDSILVRDFVAVLDHVDQIVSEIDRKPAQVAIEAMILEVSIKDEYSFGVDFEFLRTNPHVRLATGSPLEGLNDLDFSSGGLKFAYLDGNTSAFVSALENIGDTNVIASPRLMVVNKARAEILIGEQLGYVNTTITETSTAQNVQFLEVGAQLRLRPFIASDGLIRMEVHPELSTGTVQVRGQFTLPEKRVTQVTTNIMVRDGCTVIIGGLMREDLQTTINQVPLLGSLPGVGVLFRNKNEKIDKREIIVLITPHIVCEPDMCCEGDEAAGEFHRRQAVYADQMSPIGKRYLGRKYYRLAQAAWAKGDQKAALRFIDLAIHFDPESRAAIDLRVDIWNGNLNGSHTLRPAPAGETLPPPIDGPLASPPGGHLPPMQAGPDGEIIVPDGTAPFIVPPGTPLPGRSQNGADHATAPESVAPGQAAPEPKPSQRPPQPPNRTLKTPSAALRMPRHAAQHPASAKANAASVRPQIAETPPLPLAKTRAAATETSLPRLDSQGVPASHVSSPKKSPPPTAASEKLTAQAPLVIAWPDKAAGETTIRYKD